MKLIRNKTSNAWSARLVSVLLILILLSCSKDEESAVILEAVTDVTLIDSGNAGNSADLGVRFTLPSDQSGIKEYGVYIVKSSALTNFNLEAAQQVAVGNFMPITITQTGFKVAFDLSSNLNDIDGDAIVEDEEYVAFVLSVPENPGQVTSVLSGGSSGIALKNENVVVTIIDNLNSATGGVAIGPDGNIYVADIGKVPDRGGARVFRVTPEGEASIFLNGGGLVDPSGNAFDQEGNLFQSNLNGNSVLKISPTGNPSVYATEGLDSPVGIAIDSENNLYVTNCGNNTISKITPDGTVSQYATSALFNCPNGIAVDDEGIIYVANFSDGRILKVTQDGNVSAIATVPGNNNGHITFYLGKFYVVGRGGNKIYTMTKQGGLTLLAGTGNNASADGPALEASFTIPNDIGVGPDGKTLYFNHAVPTDGTFNSPSMVKKIVLKRE